MRIILNKHCEFITFCTYLALPCIALQNVALPHTTGSIHQGVKRRRRDSIEQRSRGAKAIASARTRRVTRTRGRGLIAANPGILRFQLRI